MKKSEYILSINPCIYGMNCHDPGAAIILDGEILFAIEEERLNGIKGSKGIFPELSIKACLDYCGIDKNQISFLTPIFPHSIFLLLPYYLQEENSCHNFSYI